MTKSETRRLGYVRDALVNGQAEDALRQVCSLLREPIPAIPIRTVTPARVVTGELVERGPQPRRTRIVDPASIRRYHEAFPLCEIRDCGQPAQVHHIKNRSLAGGDDVPSNYLSLCPAHHLAGSSEGFHFLGPRRFLDRFCKRLSSENIRKIVQAWKLEEEVRA